METFPIDRDRRAEVSQIVAEQEKRNAGIMAGLAMPPPARRPTAKTRFISDDMLPPSLRQNALNTSVRRRPRSESTDSLGLGDDSDQPITPLGQTFPLRITETPLASEDMTPSRANYLRMFKERVAMDTSSNLKRRASKKSKKNALDPLTAGDDENIELTAEEQATLEETTAAQLQADNQFLAAEVEARMNMFLMHSNMFAKGIVTMYFSDLKPGTSDWKAMVTKILHIFKNFQNKTLDKLEAHVAKMMKANPHIVSMDRSSGELIEFWVSKFNASNYFKVFYYIDGYVDFENSNETGKYYMESKSFTSLSRDLLLTKVFYRCLCQPLYCCYGPG